MSQVLTLTPTQTGNGDTGKRLNVSGRSLVRALLYCLACLGNVLACSSHGMASSEERRDTQESEQDQARTCHSFAHDIHLNEGFKELTAELARLVKARAGLAGPGWGLGTVRCWDSARPRMPRAATLAPKARRPSAPGVWRRATWFRACDRRCQRSRALAAPVLALRRSRRRERG